MWLQIIISGLLLGGIYALIASGFSLISGVMKLLNFCHGALIMLGAYITYWCSQAFGLNLFITIPIAMLLLFALGYVIQKFILNYIVKAPTYMTLIFTFGLDMIIVNLALLAWTGDVRTASVPYSGISIRLAGASVPVLRLFVFGVTVLATIGLYLLMTRTRFGKAIEAARMDLDAARLNGVNIAQAYAKTFALGAAMAGCAGSLLSMLGPITPTMGSLYSVKAFAICILGGSGSMIGPFIGGLIVGVLETVGVSVLGSGFQEAISFVLLLIVLVIRPRGIMGKEY